MLLSITATTTAAAVVVMQPCLANVCGMFHQESDGLREITSTVIATLLLSLSLVFGQSANRPLYNPACLGVPTCSGSGSPGLASVWWTVRLRDLSLLLNLVSTTTTTTTPPPPPLPPPPQLLQPPPLQQQPLQLLLILMLLLLSIAATVAAAVVVVAALSPVQVLPVSVEKASCYYHHYSYCKFSYCHY